MQILDEKIDKEVITTQYVLNKNSLITNVYYDEDGDWQFLGNEDVSPKDAMVVSLEQILNHDASLKGLPNLEEGESAFRENRSQKWQKKI